MSLCYIESVLLRVGGRVRQFGHTENPHRIGSGYVYQLGRVEVSQLLQVVDDSDHEGANERRAHEAQSKRPA